MKLINGIKSKKTYWLFALLCAMLWGSAAICIKLAYAYFPVAGNDSGSQLLMIGCRFFLAGLFTLLIFGLARKQVPVPENRAALGHIAVLSMTQIAVLYGCYSIGTAHASGTVSSMLNGTSTFFTILFATFVFRTERMTLKKALACVMGFGAVAVMNARGAGEALRFTFVGEGMLMLSHCMAGLSHNLTKRYSRTDDPAMLFAYQALLGGALLILAGLALGGHLSASWRGWAMVVYLAFVSAVAFSVWGLLMKYHSVSGINIFMLANPLFGVLFSALLLGEKAQAFSLRTLIALLLIAGGILLLNVRTGTEKKTAVAEDRTENAQPQDYGQDSGA